MRMMGLVKPRAAVTLDGKTPRQQWVVCIELLKKCNVMLTTGTAIGNLAPMLSFQDVLPKIFLNTNNKADTHN